MEKTISYWNNLAVEAVTDEDAFTEIYNHFFPRVYKFILAKTTDADTTDEIISNTFLKMYEHLQNYNPQKAAFSTWLFSIAENEIKMFWRSKYHRADYEEEFDEEFDPAAPEFDEPENQILQSEREIQIRRALEKLSDRERQIIEMTYWLNYPPRKIAEVLNMTPNYVSVTLKRAKASLKNFLETST